MVVTLDDRDRVLDQADILVEGGRITRVDPSSVEAPQGTRVIDGRDRIAFPGMVNAHSHSPLSFAKGIYDKVNHRAAMWMFQGMTANRTPEEVRLGALLNALEMIRTGTTSVIDHFPEQGFGPEDVAAVVEGYRAAGLRTHVALRIFDGEYTDIFPPAGLFPQALTDAMRNAGVLKPASCAELEQLCRAAIERFHRPGSRITVGPAPSNPIRCSDELNAMSARLAEEYGTGVHCHLLETRVQAELAQKRFGRTMVRHLDSLGVLSARLSCAHVIWIGDEDIALLAERGVVVVHNPQSNVRGGSGIAPIGKMLRAGVNVAIGADGSPSGGNQALHHALRLATILSRPHEPRPADWVSTRDALGMATKGGAAAMGMQGELGAIAPGYRADLVLYDLNSPWWTPLNDPVHQFVYSEIGASADTVVIDGELVMENGRVLAFDAAQVLRDVRAAHPRILARNAGLLDLARRLAEAAL
jgi:5-methylthioadenosine/S-adenosylhomocysteine deaminase